MPCGVSTGLPYRGGIRCFTVGGGGGGGGGGVKL